MIEASKVEKVALEVLAENAGGMRFVQLSLAVQDRFEVDGYGEVPSVDRKLVDQAVRNLAVRKQVVLTGRKHGLRVTRADR